MATANVVIAGGGTGGHTSPGLAVAALLRERSIPCAWIGSRSGIEAQRVPLAGIRYVAISTGKLRRYWAWQNVGDLAVNVPMGMLGAVRALRALRPKVVFGTGGFVVSADDQSWKTSCRRQTSCLRWWRGPIPAS